MFTLLAVRDDIIEGKTFYFQDDSTGLAQAQVKLRELRENAEQWIRQNPSYADGLDLKMDCALQRICAGETDSNAEDVDSEDDNTEDEDDEPVSQS